MNDERTPLIGEKMQASRNDHKARVAELEAELRQAKADYDDLDRLYWDAVAGNRAALRGEENDE